MKKTKKRKILIESTLPPKVFTWQTLKRKIRVLSAGVIFSANLRDKSELKPYFISPGGMGETRWLEVHPDTVEEDFIWWDVSKNGRLPNMPPVQPMKRKTRRTRTWTVKGSKGKTYTVVNKNGYVVCDCPGFVYRRKCKHIQQG